MHAKTSPKRGFLEKHFDARIGESIELRKKNPKGNIGQLRSLLEGFKTNNEKNCRLGSSQGFSGIERDYILNFSNSNSKISIPMSPVSPEIKYQKKLSPTQTRKILSIKIDKVSDPIRLGEPRKSIADCRPKQKSGKSADGINALINKKEDCNASLVAADLFHKMTDEEAKNKRFNLTLKKTGSLTKRINKRLKTSLDESSRALKVTLRNALIKNKGENRESIMIGDQLDSSIEKDDWPEDVTEDLTALRDIQKHSAGYDNKLIKVTEGSTHNASKIISNRQNISPANSRGRANRLQASFFDESIITNKKENILSKNDLHKRQPAALDYYFSKLLQSDHPMKPTFIDHFELTAKSYLLASKLSQSPDSFLVKRMVYLPPNPQSKQLVTRKENFDPGSR